MKFKPRFSLRTMFAVIAVFASLAWAGLNYWEVRERENILRRINSDVQDGLFQLHTDEEIEPQLPLMWRLFGARPLTNTDVRLSRERWTAEDIAKVERLFPEADVWVSDHYAFTELTRPALVPYVRKP